MNPRTEPGADPVPEDVRTECKRLAERWSQLPLDRALRHVPTMHAYVVELAHVDAENRGIADGVDVAAVLGEPRPERVIDQLAAVLFDLYDAGGAPSGVADRLIDLRRSLA